MTIYDAFKEFCDNINIKNNDEIITSIEEIAKKLNCKYYNIENDGKSNMLIVGSLGRRTATKDVSDVDLIFTLPQSVYYKYDAYESNGQSSLLQDVKNILLERYPRTDISGDGQVVVIEFEKYTIELVPGFRQFDDSFLYPDTHDGGRWQITKPIIEKEYCEKANEYSNGIFTKICQIIRSWKNTNTFLFSGILIDTLIYNHFSKNNYYFDYDYDKYLQILKNIFSEFSQLDNSKEYWYALGSYSIICDKGENEFIDESKNSYEKIKDIVDSSNESLKVLQDVFGMEFPIEDEEEDCNNRHRFVKGTTNEQFIENLYPVDIKNRLKIDCEVSQDGFRTFLLSTINVNSKWLSKNKSLKFYIKNTDCKSPYDIAWKVRNVGEIAKAKNMIRGEIKVTNSNEHKEHTDFYGPHYVECYIIKNGVCVARDRICVPISNI